MTFLSKLYREKEGGGGGGGEGGDREGWRGGPIQFSYALGIPDQKNQTVLSNFIEKFAFETRRCPYPVDSAVSCSPKSFFKNLMKLL